jgi:hypothetical protein
MGKRTITLSDRPPVTIDEGQWDVIAVAQDEEHDGQVKCQANRVSNWAIRVRRHADGRAIVSATYSYSSNWQGARGYSVKHGTLLPKEEATDAAVCEEIKRVAGRMAEAEHHGDDAARWKQLADDCIADLPAEELA